ncbi:hypothetical protein DES53_107290 [Roseimicrobium gellanilyticum]|uniref:DUF4190 domain-containing protein n=1 Tax=Roseimicrobium gellanilyticum TaxID=748857 RepID=A0A366HG22_9BACT|nr:hypothetical protein [Roseimicrobium gellanilyticum]RBP41458.1 hypothetical protein DES53_107290 [Roseimicrobium gellanilyticum]
MKVEVIPPARLGSCLFTLFAIAMTTLVLLVGLGGALTFLALVMCLTTVVTLGLRALPGSTALKIDEQGFHLTDYYVPSSYRWSEVGRFELAKTGWQLGRPNLQNEKLSIYILPSNTQSGAKITLPALKTPPRELLAKVTQYKAQADASPPPMLPPPLPAPASTGILKVLTVVGYLCSLLALIVCPPLFGTAGFILGSVLSRKGILHGHFIKGLSLVLGVIGIFIGIAIVAWQESSSESKRKKAWWEDPAAQREVYKYRPQGSN